MPATCTPTKPATAATSTTSSQSIAAITRESVASMVQASAIPIRRKRACAMVSVVFAITTDGTLSS